MDGAWSQLFSYEQRNPDAIWVKATLTKFSVSVGQIRDSVFWSISLDDSLWAVPIHDDS